MEFTDILLILLLGAALWLAGDRLRERRRRADAPGPDLLTQVQATADAHRREVLAKLDRTVDALQRQMAALTGQVNDRLKESHTALRETQDSIGKRLDHSARVTGDVHRKLGQLEEASQRIMEVGKDLGSLQDILQSPKVRSGLGETFLGELLGQVLPPEAFTLQHRFSNNEVVDAVIRLRDGLVPVDAKFPLENFRRILAAEDDPTRARARTAFRQDVRRHVDAIAGRYIRPEEGTLEFALMYIPAENVYYEAITDDGGGGEALYAYALGRRVIPTSPVAFYAHLQTIALGLKGLRIEERAREILDGLKGLQLQMGRVRKEFEVTGKHLQNALGGYDRTQQQFQRLDAGLEKLSGPGEEADSEALPDGDTADQETA